MKYITNDGLEIVAGDARDVIRQLRRTSWAHSASESDFMSDMAGRAEMQTGARVSTTSHTQFVRDLVDAGLLVEKDDGSEA